jgi:multidrug efflux pump subunit AcrA (membrane-fusion protein)
MACNVKLTAYRKEGVLTVPTSAIFSDEDDDELRYVYVAGDKKSKPQKRTVKIGKTAGMKAEIVEGLREGDEILASKPDDRAASLAPTKSPAEED